jgi:methyl-accepting chemotaxis protein
MSNSKNNRKIKNFLINKKFQIKYLVSHLALAFVLIASYCFVFYKYINENYQVLVDLAPMSDDVKKLLYGELHQIYFLLAIFTLVFLIGIGLLSLLFSHRIAGPLHQLNNICRSIAKGNEATRLKFRGTDEFKDVEKSFNLMVERISLKK